MISEHYNKMDNAIKVTIKDIVKVHPKYMGSNINEHIQTYLKHIYEDKCSFNGYILPNSISNIRPLGMIVEASTLKGYTNAHVEFDAMAWNPVEKTTVMATVKTSNNFGILCTVDMNGREVMHIIIPRQIATIKSTKDLSTIKQGSKIEVLIVKRKMNVKADVLSAIGIVTSDAKYIQDTTEDDIESKKEDNVEDDFDIDFNEEDVEDEIESISGSVEHSNHSSEDEDALDGDDDDDEDESDIVDDDEVAESDDE